MLSFLGHLRVKFYKESEADRSFLPLFEFENISWSWQWCSKWRTNSNVLDTVVAKSHGWQGGETDKTPLTSQLLYSELVAHTSFLLLLAFFLFANNKKTRKGAGPKRTTKLLGISASCFFSFHLFFYDEQQVLSSSSFWTLPTKWFKNSRSSYQLQLKTCKIYWLNFD